MKKDILRILEIAAVFIGTIVGAGLASGAEIRQFFTSYGFNGFYGIMLCGIIYILFNYIIIKISTKNNITTYNELISLVSPGFLGKITDITTSFFLICGGAIILAASGALVHQYFGFSKWIGIIVMSVLTLIILLRDTKGLIEVNSFIVPSLIIILSISFIMYLYFSGDNINLEYLKNIPSLKNSWFISTLVYAGFNILSTCGVLVPLCNEIKSTKKMFLGVTIGSIALTILCSMINLMLLLNIPYVFQYEIPLMYIFNRFGKLIQVLLLVVVYLEMFSTAISDVFSVSKSLGQALSIPYKKLVFIILIVIIPLSQVGFINLISVIYPMFGVLSLVFMGQCVYYYVKNHFIN